MTPSAETYGAMETCVPAAIEPAQDAQEHTSPAHGGPAGATASNIPCHVVKR